MLLWCNLWNYSWCNIYWHNELLPKHIFKKERAIGAYLPLLLTPLQPRRSTGNLVVPMPSGGAFRHADGLSRDCGLPPVRWYHRWTQVQGKGGVPLQVITIVSLLTIVLCFTLVLHRNRYTHYIAHPRFNPGAAVKNSDQGVLDIFKTLGFLLCSLVSRYFFKQQQQKLI